MMQEDKSSSTSGGLPVVASTNETIARLRAENAQLRAELAELRADQQTPPATSHPDAQWQAEMEHGIVYADGLSSISSVAAGPLLTQLAGLSKERMKAGQIKNSSEFDYLPRPSDDEAQLEADFVRWGFCMVKDAMSPDQVQAQVDRLSDQASAERAQNQGILTGFNDSAQLVNNLVLKGCVFRDAVEFKSSAAQGGPLVDRLLTKVMGEKFALGCAHGSIIHTGGGLQELHIDQGSMPLPYPPFPFGSLIIWCYSEFDLTNGGTYIVPGSHRNATGTTSFSDGVDLVGLLDAKPGLVAICAPPGTCILTDTRVLHCGGRRTAPGTRYAMRCHYNRAFMKPLHEQSSANQHVPNDVYELLSPRLKQMMGVMVNDEPIGELRGDES
jgi:hypothetical protein